jgi:hypothetical protein
MFIFPATKQTPSPLRIWDFARAAVTLGHFLSGSRPRCEVSPLRGLAQFIPITRFCAEEHRARVDGRATARHFHGTIERAVRCGTVKVSAESAGAVASTMFFQSLTT